MGKVEDNKKLKMNTLLQTAFDLFTGKGFAKTTVSDIVNQAGLAKGTFYLYFKDKYDLRDKLIAFKASQLFDDAHKALDAAVIPDRRYGRGREPLGRGSYGPVLFGGKRFLPDKAVYGQPARPALQALSGAHREAEAHPARLAGRRDEVQQGGGRPQHPSGDEPRLVFGGLYRREERASALSQRFRKRQADHRAVPELRRRRRGPFGLSG